MTTVLRVVVRLDGTINFSLWKARIVLIWQENELWDIVNNTTANLITVPTFAADKAMFDKKYIKEKIIILDAIKDDVIPQISSKDYAHQMLTALTSLHQSLNETGKWC